MTRTLACLLSAGVLTLLLLAGCDSAEEEPQWHGEAQALKNGEPWPALPFANNYLRDVRRDSIALSFEGLGILGLPTDHVYVVDVPLQTGIYTLRRGYGGPLTAGCSIAYGDAVVGSYVLDEAAENRVVIERYDPATRELEGQFQMTFVVEHHTDPEAPDTLRFTEGRFSTVVGRKGPPSHPQG